MTEKAFQELARGKTVKQVGVISHGGGINHEAFESSAEKEGLVCVQMDGYTMLMRVS